MKRHLLACLSIMLLAGCLHNTPDYPGAVGSTVIPAEYTNSVCPDFSGIYEGNGHLVSGAENARIYEQRMYFDRTFPITEQDIWRTLRKNYRQDGHGILLSPDFATVTNVGDRIVQIAISYKDGPVGAYRSNYVNKARFVCADGKLLWGGMDGINGRSEWGTNTGSQSFSISKDLDGGLIYTHKQQVHMNMIFSIPTGTAESYSVYRFKKIDR